VLLAVSLVIRGEDSPAQQESSDRQGKQSLHSGPPLAATPDFERNRSASENTTDFRTAGCGC
jgi:hypothetical protein